MSWLVTLSVAAAALIFVALSATMNALFLSSLGRTPLEAALLAAVSVAADIAKAMLPVVLMRAARLRAWLHVLAATAVLMVVVALSLTSGIGFAALIRDRAAAAHEAAKDTITRQRREILDIEQRLGQLGSPRATTVIDAALSHLAIDRRWTTTRGCAAIEGAQPRQFCSQYHGLRTERATAAERDRLEAARVAAQERLATQLDGGQPAPDAQSRVLAEAFGVGRAIPLQILAFFLAGVVEVGSIVLILLVAGPAVSGWREPGSEPVPPFEPVRVPQSRDVARWHRDRENANPTRQRDHAR